MSLKWLYDNFLSNEDQNPQPKQDIQQESKTPKKEESSKTLNPCEYPKYLTNGWVKSKSPYTAKGTIKITGGKGGEIDIGKSSTVYFLKGHIQHDRLLDVGDDVVVRYHKYVKGNKTDYKACEVRRHQKEESTKTLNPCEYPKYLTNGWVKSKSPYTAKGTIKITGGKGGEIDIGKSSTVYFLKGHIQHDRLLDVGDDVVVRYHKYVKGNKTDYKACEVKRDTSSAAPAVVSHLEQGFEGAHCIETKGHIFQISKPPKDFGFIKAKIPIRFDLKSVDVRPAKFELTAGMIVYIDFNMDSHGKLYTEHIVALKQERLQGITYSEGVVKFVKSRSGFGQIMADVTIYYKMRMIPGAKLHDEVYTQAKIVSQGRLSAISVSRPSSRRARRRARHSSGSPTKNLHSNVSTRKARSARSSPNGSPGRYEKKKNSHGSPTKNLHSNVSTRKARSARSSPNRSPGRYEKKKNPHGSPTKNLHSNVSTRKAKSARSSPNRSPERYEKEKNSHETTAGRINKVQDGVVTISLFKEEGVSNKEFSMDKCEYANPDVGDIVNVEYERDEKGSCSRILRVQKILTKIGTVKNVGPVSGFIIVKTEQEDVYFERNCCQIAQPVEGDTVQVSYIHSCGKLKALHICDVETQSKDKDEGEQNQVSSSAKGNELPAGFEDLRNDVDHDGLSGEHLKIDKKDGNQSGHAGFKFGDFLQLFRPVVQVQMQVDNPTLWKHYKAGDYKRFVKSIGPALKIKIAAENPGKSSDVQKKLKMELIVKLWTLMGGNFAHEQSEN
eukprot:jgi/Bigna1/90912/estExt_fgenesh1_pg.C_820080